MRGHRTDGNHKATAEALRKCGYPYIDLSAVGHGCEDFLVGIICGRTTRYGVWVALELKVPEHVRKDGKPYIRHTPAQRDWYARTQFFPRIVALGAEDAVNQLRAMQGHDPAHREEGNP